MSLPQPKIPFGPDDYLAWEQDQPCRNEYVDGKVFAKGGASDAHGTAAGNLAALLHAALRGKPCRPFIADMKVHVEVANSFFYPDILVTCDPRDRQPEASLAKQWPSLIVEVLSDSTAALDRGRKFELYQQIDTLQEYLLIEQDRKHADLFRKNSEGLWVLHPAGEGDVIRLESVGVELALDGLYEDVEL